VLWLNTRLPGQRISHPTPAPAASSTSTRMQSSAGSHTCPTNVGTCNPRGLTRPALDSSGYKTTHGFFISKLIALA